MARRNAATGPHGILIVDKPQGPTSHDLVSRARRQFSTRRVGHAGTLDPMATGVLILLLGEATKLSNHLTGSSKRYVATVRFGSSTDSLDAEGHTVEQVELQTNWLTLENLQVALRLEHQRLEQIPPTVSAIKVDGQRSYRLHRAGAPPVLPPRPVVIRSIALESWSSEQATVILHVSKGYYVRSFARDLGLALGVPAHLSRLRRLSSGIFDIREATPWPPPPERPLLSLHRALPRIFPTYRLAQEGVIRARQGKALLAEHFESSKNPAISEELVAWTDQKGTPVALGHQAGDEFRVTRGFIPLPENTSN